MRLKTAVISAPLWSNLELLTHSWLQKSSLQESSTILETILLLC